MRYLSKRTWVGALLFLVFVGEPTVGFRSGLLTSPGGFIVLLSLYVVLFVLYEALVQRFHLTNGKLILLTFAIYSIGVTGLLHGEIGDYALHPQNDLITTLIRIQSSLFVPFAYYVLNRFSKRDPQRVLSVGKALLAAAAYVLILTPTHKFGITVAIDTFRVAPVITALYSLAGLIALIMALKPSQPGYAYKTTMLTIWTGLLFAVAIVPVPVFFLLLVLLMPIVTLVYWRVPAWRNAPA